MRRISHIRTTREADLEQRREALRDRRWARRRSMLWTSLGALSVLGAISGTWQGAADVIRNAIGL